MKRSPYHFSALALGILGALGQASRWWISAALTAMILLVMAVGDHPRLLRGYRRQILVLDTRVHRPGRADRPP